MTIYYSGKENGFYDDTFKNDYIAAGTWPTDATEISDRWYQHLLEGQALGRIITVNEYGQPILSDPPPLTKEQLILIAAARKSALMTRVNEAIAPLQDAADPEIGLATDEEKTQLLDWKKYRVLLNRIDPALAPDIEWPSPPN